jgi:hypothetical protein
MGFGLKLFPTSFLQRGYKLFEQIDSEYIYTEKGIKERK